jgi:hypothetical protein
MSYNKSDINLDNSDLYEYVTELKRIKNSYTNVEHLQTPKLEKIRKYNSINYILIIAIIFLLIGLYYYFNKNVKNNKNIQQDMLLSSYYF